MKSREKCKRDKGSESTKKKKCEKQSEKQSLK